MAKLLTVKPVKAQLTRDVSFFGTMDPYVILTLEEQIYKSEIHKDGGKHPHWKFEITFKNPNPSSILNIKVYSEGVATDTQVGTATIEIEKLIKEAQTDKRESVNLYYSGKLCGLIEFDLEYTDQGLRNNIAPIRDELTKAVEEQEHARMTPKINKRNVGLDLERPASKRGQGDGGSKQNIEVDSLAQGIGMKFAHQALNIQPAPQYPAYPSYQPMMQPMQPVMQMQPMMPQQYIPRPSYMYPAAQPYYVVNQPKRPAGIYRSDQQKNTQTNTFGMIGGLTLEGRL